MTERKKADDAFARTVGNRAIKHLQEMYPKVFAEMTPSCRTSLRNVIRNDVNGILNGLRVWKVYTLNAVTDQSVGIEDVAPGGQE